MENGKVLSVQFQAGHNEEGLTRVTFLSGAVVSGRDLKEVFSRQLSDWTVKNVKIVHNGDSDMPFEIILKGSVGDGTYGKELIAGGESLPVAMTRLLVLAEEV